MSTRAPSSSEDDDFTADEARAIEAFLAALFGTPAPRKKRRPNKRSVRSARYVQSVRSGNHPARLANFAAAEVSPAPDVAYTFTCHEPRFKSVGVFAVQATSHREACAQVLLHADAIADAMRAILNQPAP